MRSLLTHNNRRSHNKSGLSGRGRIAVISALVCSQQIFHLFNGKNWNVLLDACLLIKTTNLDLHDFMDFRSRTGELDGYIVYRQSNCPGIAIHGRTEIYNPPASWSTRGNPQSHVISHSRTGDFTMEET